MGSSVEADYIENIVTDMRMMCRTLEEIGFDSLIILASKDRHMEMGSARGQRFIEDNANYTETFIQYCKVKIENENETLETESSSPTNRKVKPATAKMAEPGVFETSVEEQNPFTEVLSEHMPEFQDHFSDSPSSDADMLDDLDEADESGLENDDIEIGSKHSTVVKSAASPKQNSAGKKRKVKKIKGQKIRTKPNLKQSATAKKTVKDNISLKEDAAKNRRGKKAYECDQCDKKYVGRKDLIVHQRIHSGEAPYTCKDCGKAFRGAGLLRSHKKSHANGKSKSIRQASRIAGSPSSGDSQKMTYDCDECDKKYISRKDLIIHQRKHTGEAPFMCHLCGKAFRGSGLLRSHKAVHATETPHACEFCGQMFNRRGVLLRHRRTVHSEVPLYACDLCEQAYKDPSALRRHKLRHAEGKVFHPKKRTPKAKKQLACNIVIVKGDYFTPTSGLGEIDGLKDVSTQS